MKPKQRKAKFRVGQVVVTNVTYQAPIRFIIGFVYRGQHANGKSFFWYTPNKVDAPPYWTEAALRPLTKRERGETKHG